MIRKKKKYKQNKWKKPFVVTLVVVAVLAIGTFSAAAIYLNSIQDSIAYTGDADAVNTELVSTPAQEPFYVLVIGSDEWENFEGHSDAMLLTRVDLDKAQITMVSIPRDTPYQLNGKTTKLNQVYTAQGEAACIDAVSQLTGVPISQYVEVRFDQLESVVDAMGGVTVDVPYTIDYQVYTKDQPTVHIDAGKQVLTGEQAVALARMRTAYKTKTDIAEDAIRQANIRAIMTSLVTQVLQSQPNEMPGRIQQLASLVETTVPLNDLVDWALKLSSADKVTMYSCTGPTQGGTDNPTGLWLTKEAPDSWAALMQVVDSGGDPTGVLTEDKADGSVKLDSKTVVEVEAPGQAA